MKKSLLFVALGFTVLFASCNSKQKEVTTEAAENQIEQTDQAEIAGIHNAQNSLDYQGVYQGKLPTASGIGMLVTVTLSDKMYQRSIEYIDKDDKPIIAEGAYAWSEERESVVILTGAAAPNQYFVSENKIYQLDMEGNRIEGDLADMYILKKQ